MPCILHIETSTSICSVASSVDGHVIFNKENKTGGSHASCLGLYMAEAVEFVRNKGLRPDAVAVSSGPGSYTGLRIGVSEAKGLCYGLGIPLIAVPSLKIMADAVIRSGVEADFYCPMIDARRMEVYAVVYDKQMDEIREVKADIVDETTYSDYLCRGRIAFFGNGSEKCKPVISSLKADFIADVYPAASSMVTLAEQSYENKVFEDVAYFEPFYLKEFMATVPKNKIV